MNKEGKMSEPMGCPVEEYRWEMRFGLALAICAAALAITELGSSKFGEDEITQTNEKSNAYMWYQAKGIKESLAEGQQDLILTLLLAGAITEEKVAELKKLADKLDVQVQRYKREKREILLGSAEVGEENWALDIDGRFGQVVGARKLENQIARLAKAGDVFDVATLCLQLCMALGAIGLLLRIPRGRRLTFMTVITLSIVGTVSCVRAYWIVFS